jgi:hypothetical protein
MTEEPIHDLETLLVSISPVLDPHEYVFASVTHSLAAAEASAILIFRESEGTTYVIERSLAEELVLPYSFPCQRITLRVVSALDAVGFLAAIAKSLALHSIPANIVSAYHHDHIFVPINHADEALHILDTLRAEHARRILSR